MKNYMAGGIFCTVVDIVAVLLFSACCFVLIWEKTRSEESACIAAKFCDDFSCRGKLFFADLSCELCEQHI